MKNLRLLGTLLPLLALTTAAAVEPPPAPASKLQPAPDPADPVVARVGSLEIRKSELLGIWSRVDPEAKKLFEAQGGLRAFLQDVASKKRIVLDAEKSGIASRPEVRLDFSVAYDSILYDRYAERRILPELLPDDQLRAEYEKRKQTWFHKARWRARHVLVTPRKDEKLRNRNADDATTSEEAEKKIEFLRQRIADGADFETLAREYSEDPTAEKGGDLGLFQKGTMVAEFESAVDALKVGEISGVVKTPYGYHLIQLLAREPEGYTPYEEVADGLRGELTAERGEEIQRRLAQRAEELEKQYPLAILDPTLQAK